MNRAVAMWLLHVPDIAPRANTQSPGEPASLKSDCQCSENVQFLKYNDTVQPVVLRGVPSIAPPVSVPLGHGRELTLFRGSTSLKAPYVF